ncbi:MAG: hypothetical protein H6933_11915 [Burkholderiaceae bacterium]|nr:hypothetical protein [Rhodoferax sp.]MCP5285595.1 hypothetical protein [Burkholderiaceae bacterium]
MSAAAPIYYLAVEATRFGSMRAFCKRMGVSEAEVLPYIAHARFHDSDIVIIDKLVLGDPAHKVCCGLKMNPGGALKVLACYFGDASEDRKEVESFAAAMLASPEFKGRDAYVGTFVPAFSREMPQ